MTIMKGTHGFAKLETILSETNYNILIMNLLGPNLEKLFKHVGSKFGNFHKISTKKLTLFREIKSEDSADDRHKLHGENRGFA